MNSSYGSSSSSWSPLTSKLAPIGYEICQVGRMSHVSEADTGYSPNESLRSPIGFIFSGDISPINEPQSPIERASSFAFGDFNQHSLQFGSILQFDKNDITTMAKDGSLSAPPVDLENSFSKLDIIGKGQNSKKTQPVVSEQIPNIDDWKDWRNWNIKLAPGCPRKS